MSDTRICPGGAERAAGESTGAIRPCEIRVYLIHQKRQSENSPFAKKWRTQDTKPQKYWVYFKVEVRGGRRFFVELNSAGDFSDIP